MFLHPFEISPESKPRDIVELDYRAADVFRQYGITYCCGMQWPLGKACEVKEIEIDDLVASLRKNCRTVSIPSQIDYESWSVDFLIDYIIHIHHGYLISALPNLELALNRFIDEHAGQFPYFRQIQETFTELLHTVVPHLRHEEETIFPYLRQVAHAFEDPGNDPLAALLVKTLRKPLASLVETEHGIISRSISRFRELTSNYGAPQGACTSHKVLLAKLKELDNDLVQHFYLENKILIARVIKMEETLLRELS